MPISEAASVCPGISSRHAEPRSLNRRKGDKYIAEKGDKYSTRGAFLTSMHSRISLATPREAFVPRFRFFRNRCHPDEPGGSPAPPAGAGAPDGPLMVPLDSHRSPRRASGMCKRLRIRELKT